MIALIGPLGLLLGLLSRDAVTVLVAAGLAGVCIQRLAAHGFGRSLRGTRLALAAYAGGALLIAAACVAGLPLAAVPGIALAEAAVVTLGLPGVIGQART